MNEIVERVARAIFATDNSGQPALTWDDDTVDWERDEYRLMARAAIEAMREPTEAMLEAGYDWDSERGRWNAMICAALE